MPLKMMSPHQISKVVNTLLFLLEVHVSYTVEIHTLNHTNCRLTFDSCIRYYCLRVDGGVAEKEL